VTEADSMGLLEKYGYIPEAKPGAGYLRTPEAIVSAVKIFQRYAGLKQSGLFDKATIAKLKAPRCGMSDKKALSSRAKRYVHQGSKWNKQKLTWKILRYSRASRRLSEGQVRRTIYQVLAKWSKVTYLDFVETSSNEPDIKIIFAGGYHQDPYQFDGRGGTLAHAFYPLDNKGFAGDAHFDDDEWFTLGSKEGTNFYWVALHEFGHSIGLEHSQKLGAIMYPWYQGYKGDDVELTNDDVKGIQALYGVRKSESVTTPAPTPIVPVTVPFSTTPKARICLNRIKAAFLGGDKKVYVFNDDRLFVLDEFLNIEKGPVPIGDVFYGLTKVDAATKIESGELVFFHGDKYWVFKGYRRISGPEPITRYGLKANMRDLDAAVSWKGSGKLYFFKGSLFWRYDVSKKRLDRNYPRHIRLWRGIPSNIDAVFQWRNKALYFFKGEKFYRFDSRRIEVVRNYPKKIRNEFAVCKAPSRSSKLSDVVDSINKPPNAASLALQSLTSILVAITAFIIRMS